MRTPLKIHSVPLQAPVDLNSLTNDKFTARFSMNKFKHASIHIRFGTILSGGDPIITLMQDTDIAGSNADKALNFYEYWKNDSTATPDDVWSKVELSSPTNSIQLAATDDDTNYKFEIDARMLDMNNNYDVITVSVAGGTGVSVFCSAHADLFMGRYLYEGMSQ